MLALEQRVVGSEVPNRRHHGTQSSGKSTLPPSDDVRGDGRQSRTVSDDARGWLSQGETCETPTLVMDLEERMEENAGRRTRRLRSRRRLRHGDRGRVVGEHMV